MKFTGRQLFAMYPDSGNEQRKSGNKQKDESKPEAQFIKHDHPVTDRHHAAEDLKVLLETEPEDDDAELVAEEVV